MAKEITSEESKKPVLDEQALAKLLEAAFVLQEHNRELQAMELSLELKREQIEAEDRSTTTRHPKPAHEEDSESALADYTFTLAKIVETQHQIQVRHLNLESAMALVSDRLAQIAHAHGAAIGVLDGKKLRYRAASGSLTLPVGSEVTMDKALCVACLRTGQVFRCADVNPEFLLDTEECKRRGIESLICVPVFHEGEVAGGIELYYPATHAFTEHDVHTCQLMAGLVTEALAREEEMVWKRSLATERAVMLDALEKLKPNLSALVDKSAAREAAAKPTVPAAPAAVICGKCGHALGADEQFCGNCGTPRSSDYEQADMQSKVASLWHMQEAMKKPEPVESRATDQKKPDQKTADQKAKPAQVAPAAEKSLADSLEEDLPELFTPAGMPKKETATDAADDHSPITAEFESVLADLEVPPEKDKNEEAEVEVSTSTALTKSERGVAWSSAAKTREYLEQLAGKKQAGSLLNFWNTRRGDIYLAIAVVLVLCVIRWGIWSNHSVSATGASTAAHHKAPDDNLSWFDHVLISVGLAEAPPTPESKGRPDVQVWVDTHTALYYCPGAELYGKTPNGKYTSQRDAQLDSYEPAYRKNCE